MVWVFRVARAARTGERFKPPWRVAAGVLLEAVPNLSMGPDDPALRAILDALEEAASPGWALLDVHADADHARTVLTLAGAPVPLGRALGTLVGAAVAHGTLEGHTGVHPRVGVLDVLPVVPLHDARWADATRLARTLEPRLLASGIPVYRYGLLAASPPRARLVTYRRAWQAGTPLEPDASPERPVPSLGVTCLGVRGPLVAVNVALSTTDLEAGARIAASVRTSGGGPPGVQALAFPLASRGGQVQVSMNLSSPFETGLPTALAAVREAAARTGVETGETELVGLAPAASLGDDPAALGLPRAPTSLEDALAGAGLPSTRLTAPRAPPEGSGTARSAP